MRNRLKFSFSQCLLILVINLNLIGIAISNSEEADSDPNKIRKLILKAATWFSNDSSLISEGYEEYSATHDSGNIIFQSHRNPGLKLKTTVPNPTDSVVILDKATDGLTPSENHTFVVMIKANETTYTIHMAYIRVIDGSKSVEWDTYGTPVELKKSFYTAMSPYDSTFIEFVEKKADPAGAANGGAKVKDHDHDNDHGDAKTHRRRHEDKTEWGKSGEKSESGDNEGSDSQESITPEHAIDWTKSLGPFYAYFIRQLALNDLALKSLNALSKKDLQKIKSNLTIQHPGKHNGHPKFESKKTPYTGLMDCKYKEKRLSDFKSTPEKNAVDYLLHALKAQCHDKIRKNILKMFDDNVVLLKQTKQQHSRIELNMKSELLSKRVLNPNEWEEFISALFMAKFCESFREQKETLEKGIDDNLSSDNQPISHSVRTLTVFVEKVMGVLRQEKFRRHAVKITSALLKIISDWSQKKLREKVILDKFCGGCRKDKHINKEDIKQLNLLSKYVILSAPDAVRDSHVTFDEFHIE